MKNKSRAEVIRIILHLNTWMIDQMKEHLGFVITKHPELTSSWLDEKFDRFHLVESTSHREEDFRVDIEVRYTLRSQEARKYGEGHDAFYKRYLSTMGVPLRAIDNPELYKEETLAEFKKKKEKEEA